MLSLWGSLMMGWPAFEMIVALVTRTRRDRGKVQDRGSMWASAWAHTALPVAALHGMDWLKMG